MSYQTYTTDAIVCGSRANNTADKSYLLLTRQNGMMWATARSSREEKSKQRFALQDFTQVRVSLVKGKSGWRVGSVEAFVNAYYDARSREDRHTVVRCLATIRRLVHGESNVPEVFDDLEQIWSRVGAGKTLSPVLSEHFIYRTLQTLGYVEAAAVAEDWLTTNEPLSKAALEATQYGLAQSHL